jgi:hypothetical protein
MDLSRHLDLQGCCTLIGRLWWPRLFHAAAGCANPVFFLPPCLQLGLNEARARHLSTKTFLANATTIKQFRVLVCHRRFYSAAVVGVEAFEVKIEVHAGG